MSTEIVAVFGKTADIRPFPTQQVTKITIEVPIEHHVAVTSMLYDRDVLITLAPAVMAKTPYGPRSAAAEPDTGGPERQEQDQAAVKDRASAMEATQNKPIAVKGGPLSELAGQWCKDAKFQAWARSQFPDVWKVLPPKASAEQRAREAVLWASGVTSRKQIDTNATLFNEYVRYPYMKHLETINA